MPNVRISFQVSAKQKVGETQTVECSSETSTAWLFILFSKRSFREKSNFVVLFWGLKCIFGPCGHGNYRRQTQSKTKQGLFFKKRRLRKFSVQPPSFCCCFREKPKSQQESLHFISVKKENYYSFKTKHQHQLINPFFSSFFWEKHLRRAHF